MLGKNGAIFPMIGKIFRQFSNDWKKIFAGGKREGFRPQRTQRAQRVREGEREGSGRDMSHAEARRGRGAEEIGEM
jgi:hypothetical protein